MRAPVRSVQRPATRPTPQAMPPAAAFALDAVLVLVFAAVGRASHEEGLTIGGLLGTAWPFLVGMGVGWAAACALRKSAPLSANDGVLVWLSTCFIGMLLRVVSGGGTAWSFLAVTMIATAVLLLGWRFVADLTVNRRS